MEVISGIYMIHNKVNHKRYIGSSKNIKARWYSHINTLRNNKHRNIKLQSSWNKYGEHAFEFLIIEYCDTSKLFEYEQFWYDYYQSYNGQYGYNLSTIAKCPDHSTQRQMAEYRLNVTPEKFAIIIFDLLNTDLTIPQIAKKVNLHKNTIYAIYYHDEYRELTQNYNFRQRTGHVYKKLSDTVIQELINDLITGMTNIQAARKYQLSPSTIAEIRNHKIYKHLTTDIIFPLSHGRQSNILRYKAVDQYDLDGNLLNSFVNARQAEEKTGVSYKHISSVCHGKRKTAGQYIWRFHNQEHIFLP